MEMTSIVVPDWMNLLSLPILIAVLLALDYCAAVWMQPTHVPSATTRADATTKEIFSLLVAFSAIGLTVGLLTAVLHVSVLGSIAIAVAILTAFAYVLLPKKLWLVAGICNGTAFFIGETLINYNALFAILLTIVMVVIILILAITIGPLSFIKTR
jgi:hypothetical protein